MRTPTVRLTAPPPKQNTPHKRHQMTASAEIWPFWCDESSPSWMDAFLTTTQEGAFPIPAVVLGACAAVMVPFLLDRAETLGSGGAFVSWILFIVSWMMWDPSATYDEHEVRMLVHGTAVVILAVVTIPCAWATVFFFIPPMHATNDAEDKRANTADDEEKMEAGTGEPPDDTLRYLHMWLPPDLHVRDKRYLTGVVVTWSLFGTLALFIGTLTFIQQPRTQGPCNPCDKTSILVVNFNGTNTLWPPESPPRNASLATSESCIHTPLSPFDLEFFVELLKPFLVSTSILAVLHAKLHRPLCLSVEHRLGRVIPTYVCLSCIAFGCAVERLLLFRPPLSILATFFVWVWASFGAALFIRLATVHAQYLKGTPQ